MFQLRERHVLAFKAAALAGFMTRAVAHVRRRFPDDAARQTDDEIRRRVMDCSHRARQYGLRSERQVMAFVDTTYLAGETFETDPACAWANLLSRGDLGADDKAALIRMCAAWDAHPV